MMNKFCPRNAIGFSRLKSGQNNVRVRKKEVKEGGSGLVSNLPASYLISNLRAFKQTKAGCLI